MADKPANSQPTNKENASSTLSDRVKSLRLSERTHSPGKSAKLPWVLAIMFFLSTVVFAGRAFRPPSSDKKTTAPATASQADSGDIMLESKGYIIPAHQSQVSPKVSGMVLSLYFEEGKRVKEGDVLAQLETTDYEADMQRAKATLEMAKHRRDMQKNGNRPLEIEQTKDELDEAIATMKQLRLEYERNQRLTPGAGLSQTDFERAQYSFQAQEKRVERLKKQYELMKIGPREEQKEAAEAEVRQAQADLTKAVWRLENCTVRAPLSGTILTKKAEQGNIVNPVAMNVSASLCDMADLSDLEVDLNIQERDIAKVYLGQQCRIKPEAFSERKYTGYVSRLMPIADRSKGAIPVRVKVKVGKDEEGVYLKPDMGVIVSFLKKKEEE